MTTTTPKQRRQLREQLEQNRIDVAALERSCQGHNVKTIILGLVDACGALPLTGLRGMLDASAWPVIDELCDEGLLVVEPLSEKGRGRPPLWVRRLGEGAPVAERRQAISAFVPELHAYVKLVRKGLPIKAGGKQQQETVPEHVASTTTTTTTTQQPTTTSPPTTRPSHTTPPPAQEVAASSAASNEAGGGTNSAASTHEPAGQPAIMAESPRAESVAPPKHQSAVRGIRRAPAWLLVLLIGNLTTFGGSAALVELRERHPVQIALPEVAWPQWEVRRATSIAATPPPAPTACVPTEVQVTGVGELPLRIRAKPGLGEAVVARVPEGALLRRGCVLLTNDSITWVSVYGDGFQGWASAAYLAPAP